MAKTRLTTLSKLLITLLIVGVIVLGVRALLTYTSLGDTLKAKTEEIQKQQILDDKAKAEKRAIKDAEKEKRRLEKERIRAEEEALKNKKILRVQVSNSANSMPGLYFNKGWKPNKDSRFFNDTINKVEFIYIPEREDAISKLNNGIVDLILQSIDEMPNLFHKTKDPNQVVMQVDWSRGDLVMIVKNNIYTVNDLSDKSVALIRGSSIETFMRKALDAAGMSIRDVKVKEFYYEEDIIKAFNSSQVEAIIVHANQVNKLLDNLKLGKVLQSTQQASHVIARTYVGKKEFITENQDLINQFYEGWMKAVEEIKSDPNALDVAAFHYSSELPYSDEEAKENAELVYLASHADNINFFKMNSSYDGLTGEDIYKEMGKEYSKMEFASGTRPRWKSIVNSSVLEYGNQTLGQMKGRVEKGKKFTQQNVTIEDLISKKPLSINFPAGQSTLTESSKSFIDVRISKLMTSYCNTRIRIEGNTANLGNPEQEVSLSNKRARAVASYLIDEYGFDANRFIVQGNGSENPVRGCETLNSDACKAKNRRTEFHFLKN